MNIKVLIDTLIEIPEVSMLDELFTHFRTHHNITVPDLKKVFTLQAVLYNNSDLTIIRKGQQLTNLLCSYLVTTEIEKAWVVCAPSLIKALGFENSQIRKLARASAMAMLKKTNNPLMFLDSLSKLGLDSEMQLVVAKSMKVICNVLEHDVNILANKASIGTVKLILQRLIEFTKSSVPLIQEKSRSALIRIFYIGVKSLQEIILRLDSHFRETLQVIWSKQKQQLGQPSSRNPNDVRFQQLPIVNKKIFDVYNPLLIQRLLKQLSASHYGKNPQQQELYGHDSRKQSILEFRLGFDMNFDKLVQFLLPLYRLLVKMLSQQTMLQEVVDMVVRVFEIPAIKNRVVLADSVRALVLLLNSEKVSLRKKIKTALNGLMPSNTFKFLDIYQESLDACRHDVQWYCIYELLDLVQQLLITSNQCFSPIFDALFHSICFYLDNSIVRVKNKSLGTLTVLVNYHPAYRQLMCEYATPLTVGLVQDKIEQKDVRGFGKHQSVRHQTKTEYDIDFQKQRETYLQYLASKGKRKYLE